MECSSNLRALVSLNENANCFAFLLIAFQLHEILS